MRNTESSEGAGGGRRGRVAEVAGGLGAEASALLKVDTGPIGNAKRGATQGLIGAVASAAAHNTNDKQALYEQSVQTLRESIFTHSKASHTLEAARQGFVNGFASGNSSQREQVAQPAPRAAAAESPRQKAMRELQRKLDAEGLNDDQSEQDRELG